LIEQTRSWLVTWLRTTSRSRVQSAVNRSSSSSCWTDICRRIISAVWTSRRRPSLCRQPSLACRSMSPASSTHRLASSSSRLLTSFLACVFFVSVSLPTFSPRYFLPVLVFWS